MVALVLFFLPSALREDLARAVRATLLRPVLALQQGAIERNALFDEPARLRAERDSLAAFLVGNATLAAENRHLRELLGIQERLPPSFVPAELIRIPDRSSEGYFQLTSGTRQGVVVGAPIVTAKGLVGRVWDVDEGISFGIDWMHPEFRAAAMTLDGEVYGILEPRRAGGEMMLVLTGTPRHVELDADVLLVTSGHGTVFPRGLPIGVVIGPDEGEEGWQRNYLVRPLVAPSEMSYVLVLGAPSQTLEGYDLALSWGIRPVEAASPADGDPGEAAPPPVTGGTAPAPAGPPVLGAPAQQTPAQQTPAQQTPAPAPAPAPPPAAPQPGGPPLLGDPVPPQ